MKTLKSKTAIKTAALHKALLAACVLFFALPTPAHAQDITSGLVGHWKLDETSGTTATDSTPAGNDGTIGSAVTFVAGKVNGSMRFDDSDANSRVLVSDSDDHDFGTGDFSLSLWFNTDGYVGQGSSSNTLTSKSNSGSTNAGHKLRIGSGNQLQYILGDGTSNGIITSAGTYNDGQWHHVVAMRESGTMKLYIDGIKDITEVVFASNISSSADLKFGVGTNFFRNFIGELDDIRLYNRALTADDIAVLASGTAPGGMRYNDETEAVEYHDGYDWLHTGLGSYSPNAVAFDGTNDNLSDTSFTVKDRKKLTFSFWVKRNSTGAQYIYSSGHGNIQFLGLPDRFSFGFTDPGVVTVASGVTSGGFSSDTSDWHHVLVSIDANSPAKFHYYVDDVDMTADMSVSQDDVMRLSSNPHIGSFIGGTGRLDGDVADFWMHFGEYIDFSVAANRRKFISANGAPMYLGPDGSLPLKQRPDIFLSGPTDDWHTNKGIGGGFTETGALTNSESQPNPATWSQIGNDLFISSNASGRITALNTTTIAYTADGNNHLRTYSWDGTDWSQVGNSLGGFGSGTQLTTLDESTIATSRGGNLRTFSWDGTDWSQVGNALIIATVSNPVITALDSTTIAFLDSQNDELRTYSWDGTDWSQVGNSLPKGVSGMTDLTTLNSNTIVYSTSANLQTYSWDGSDWSQVGNTFTTSFTNTNHPGLTTLNDHTVVLANADDNVIQSFSWDGTDWSYVGEFATVAGMNSVTVTTLDSNARKIAFLDSGNDDLRVYQFGLCSSPSEPQGSILYNTDQKVMQYCNGTDWVAMGPVGGTGGGGCASPAGNAGDLIFNDDLATMQYCNSEDWTAIGRAKGAPTDGLVGHWKLDETTGTTADDATANNNDGTMNGGLDAANDAIEGRIGIAGLSFDGTDDYIRVGNVDLIEGQTEASVCFWMNYGASSVTSDGTIAGSFTGTPGWMLWVDDTAASSGRTDTITFMVEETAPISNGRVEGTTGLISPNTWDHYCGTFSGSNYIRIYKNGVLDGENTTSIPATVDSGSGNLDIGQQNNGTKRFPGTIDEVRIYDRALSAAEVNQLYQARW